MKTCILVVGHRKKSPGAVNTMTGLNEFLFNNALATDIKNAVENIKIKIIYRKTYASLPYEINSHKPDFIISLHCNAFNQKATRTETLFHHRSSNGMMVAQILNNHIVNALQLYNRGIKPKSVEDRGGYLLKNTLAPCVIAEPFFIDNDSDLKTALDKKEQLIMAYVNAIHIIAKTLK